MVLSKDKCLLEGRITHLLLAIAAAGVICTSCLTTGGASPSGGQDEETSTVKNGGNKAAEKEEAQKKATENAQREANLVAFIRMISDTDLSIVSHPNTTVKNKAFSSPFVVSAIHADGTPAAGFDIMVSYPNSRNGDVVSFATAFIKTDADGKASFMPDTPRYAFDSTITFTPKSDIQDATAMDSCAAAAVSEAYRVRTNMTSNGGMMYVWDYNENAKPLVNDPNFLKEMMTYGVTNVGNAPFPTAAGLDMTDALLHNAARAYINKGFIIYGKVTYDAPVSVLDNGKASCSLTAHVKCMDIASGEVLYATVRSTSAVGNSKALAIDACRKQLAKITVKAVMYGM